MPEQLLHLIQGAAGIQDVRSERVPELMRMRTEDGRREAKAGAGGGLNLFV